MKDHGFKFYNIFSKQWEPIPGPCYVVSLPIALDLPALSDPDNMLIVHHSLGKHPADKKWTVSHKATGGVIAKGRTRGDAMKNAQALLLKVGNQRFIDTIAHAKYKTQGA